MGVNSSSMQSVMNKPCCREGCKSSLLYEGTSRQINEWECKETIGWCKPEQYPKLIIAKFLQTQQTARETSEKDTVTAQMELSRNGTGAERKKLRKVCPCHSSKLSTNFPSSVAQSLAQIACLSFQDLFISYLPHFSLKYQLLPLINQWCQHSSPASVTSWDNNLWRSVCHDYEQDCICQGKRKVNGSRWNTKLNFS